VKPLDPEKLHTILDDDLVWRRRELTSLVTLIGVSNAADKAVLVRSAIPLLYAHWEGFGKLALQRYLEYVSLRNKKLKDLKPSFIYLANLGRVGEIGSSPPLHTTKLLIDVLQSVESVNRNPFRKAINTKSNLRYDVLVDLLNLCGLNAAHFETEKDFINQQLCDARNEIAHGSGGAPAVDTFIRRRDKTFELMTQLQTIIVNAAINRDFHK